MTTTLEAPQKSEVDAGEAITRTQDLPDEVKADIIAQREAGTTLAELKANFPQVAPDVIRDVLPAGNARERKAKEAKAKVTETTQGTGGRSGKAKSEAKPKPKAEPTPRYVEGKQVVDLAERVLAARQVTGRNRLAELLETTTGSAVWRFENGRIHPSEVDALQAGLKKVEDRIAAGEFVKPEAAPKGKQPSKADLTHRVEVAVELVKAARGDKGITKAGLVDSLLAVLVPPVQAEEATESK
jgi:hypothetical protein